MNAEASAARGRIFIVLPPKIKTKPKGEQAASRSGHERSASPSTLNGESLTPLSSNRRRLLPKAALAGERPAKRLKTKEVAPGTIEVQNGSCNAVKYKHALKCTACIVGAVPYREKMHTDRTQAKKAGEPCRFRGIRAFLVSSSGTLEGPAIFHRVPLLVNQMTPTLPQFNKVWYSQPTREDIQHIKVSPTGTVVARLI